MNRSNPIESILAAAHSQPGMYSIVRVWPRVERLAIHLKRSHATDQYHALALAGQKIAQVWRGYDGNAYILRQTGN